MLRIRSSSVAAIVLIGGAAGSAHAAVDLRVEARPVSDPIQAYITVTDASGAPITGLTSADFTVLLDGKAVTLQPADVTLPPAQNLNQRLSVAFVMDYSQSTEGAPRTAMENAVLDFLNGMSTGDYAAILKFNGETGTTIVQPFTPIATGLSQLLAAAVAPYTGRNYTNLYDASHVALQHLKSSLGTLPAGPKAVIVISDGEDNCTPTLCPKASNATFDSVLAEASADGFALFTISLATAGSQGDNVLKSLAARTGGDYFSAQDPAAVTSAYDAIATSLANEYLITFTSSITDCNVHTIKVTTGGQSSADVKFTRCDAPKPPAPSGGGGGGGGAIGFPEALIGGTALLLLRRRRRWT